MSKSALSGVNRIILRKVATILGTDRHKGLKMKTDGLVEEIITRAPDASPDHVKAIRELPELQETELAALETVLSGKKKAAAKPKTKTKPATNGEKPTRRRRTAAKPGAGAVSSSPGHEDLVIRLDALGAAVDSLTDLVKQLTQDNIQLKAGLTTVVCCTFEPIDSLEELVVAEDPDGE